MSSILTNNGAMVALQTLRDINAKMNTTQNAIATGKDVSNAKENAAVWAISKVMESDVSGFKAISDNLGLGQATVSVARQAAETTTELLRDMKEKIVSAQEENVDRNKIQADIEALRNQIDSVTSAAQFNGLNLLRNRDRESGSGSVDMLASLDRSANGVDASDITVRKQDLGTAESVAATGGTLDDLGTVTMNTTAATVTLSLEGTVAVAAGVNFTLNLDVATAGLSTAAVDMGMKASWDNIDNTGAATIGEVVGSDVISYMARDGDTLADVANGLVTAFNSWRGGQEVSSSDLNVTTNGTAGELVFTVNNAGWNSTDTLSIVATSNNSEDNVIGGGLEALSSIDVTTDTGVLEALGNIEGLIQNAIDAAASFGSSENRITTQLDFVSSLMDAMKSGIGTLVDADMEEQSARLQALQVQQQLGVQALSIANQAPQQLLSLFQ